MDGKFVLEVSDKVHPGPTVDYTMSVVPGESLYQSMLRLQAHPVSGFTFATEESSLGHFVTKINGLEEVPDKDYWMIYINTLKHPSLVGVDMLMPSHGERYIFAYTNTTADHPNKMKK